MFTISNIIADIQRGITTYNMNEDYFSYRLVYFINSESGNKKYYIDSKYDDLRKSLENIIRKNLTTTNCLVLAAVTVRKNGETVSLLSKAYSFSLDEYFKRISGECSDRNRSGNYNRYALG